MEKTNLTLSQVIDIMEVKEFAVIVKDGELKISPSGRPYISKPSALYWDEKDDLILKSTTRKDNFGIEICKAPKKCEPILYDIVDAAGFVEYLLGNMSAKENLTSDEAEEAYTTGNTAVFEKEEGEEE